MHKFTSIVTIGLYWVAASVITGNANADPPLLKSVGGQPAAAGEYPFQVALLKTDRYGEGQQSPDRPLDAFACGATHLDGPWLLTAAHCVAYRRYDLKTKEWPAGCIPDVTDEMCVYAPDTLDALVGTQELRAGAGKRFPIVEVVVNDGYRTSVNDHDIAVIRLAQAPAQPRTMLIADEAFTTRAQKDGALARAVGWGTQSEGGGTEPVLRQIDIPLQPLERCRVRYRLWDVWKDEKPPQDIRSDQRVTTSELCVGWDRLPPGYTGGAMPNVCWGDSGGFVGVKDKRGRWVQMGIPSWQHDCDTPYLFSVETNIAVFRSWIEKKTELKLKTPK